MESFSAVEPLWLKECLTMGSLEHCYEYFQKYELPQLVIDSIWVIAAKLRSKQALSVAELEFVGFVDEYLILFDD